MKHLKHLNKFFVAVFLALGLNASAQDSDNPWAISFGANAVDTRISAPTSVKDQINEFYNVKKNWNIIPSVSYLTV
ncbi:MAG TPA: OmpA family protein, partial [Flavobacterium sp.]|nr:OmpA family protein [Flavobacterium sp.]